MYILIFNEKHQSYEVLITLANIAVSPCKLTLLLSTEA